MSFLTPLYLAGLAALALPVLFHLIRRTPADRKPFGSVMFLSPSPPRLTRRNRIEHWLLLLLRAAALALVAFAFARPFLTDATELPLGESPQRRVAILVDTSASMRREGVFAQAIKSAEQALDELGPRDEAGLFSFDRQVTTHVGWGENSPQLAAERRTIARQELSELEPTWQATNLGAALVELADTLEATREAETAMADAQLEIVLVSDLQQGGRLDALQSFPWPASVRLTVEEVVAAGTTNASPRLVERGVGGSELSAETDQRIRVTNAGDSRESQFQLEWQTAGESPRPVGCYVPPGESRVVKLPLEEGRTAVAIRLTGDDEPFDNVYHVALPPQEQLVVQYFGPDAADESAGVHYFLARAFPESARRTVRVESGGEINREAALYVVSGELAADQSAAIRECVEQGANVLCVLTSAEQAGMVRKLAGDEAVEVTEAKVPDYAILAHVDLKHPLLAPFADARFSDFTKIHFWKHRDVQTGDAGWQELARFDSGAPALLAKRLGRGELFVLASSWRPVDSQLALSTKFVPLVGQMLQPRHEPRPASYAVGEPIPLDAFPEAILEMRLPTGEAVATKDVKQFTAADAPGVYNFVGAASEYAVAVNLAAAESDTTPLDVTEFEPYGVNVPQVAVAANTEAATRKLRDTELERRQSLWRWLILGVAAILLMETVLAGRMTRVAASASLGPSPTS